MDATARGRAAVSLRAPELRAVLWENPMYGILGGALETWPMVELCTHRVRAPALYPTG